MRPPLLCCNDAEATPVRWWDVWGPSQPIGHTSSHKDARAAVLEGGLLVQDSGKDISKCPVF